jgi:methylenetetrahydrofolate dehydrogenase (NADP+)/methenyltetrahydrofolate cyclohydrolase
MAELIDGKLVSQKLREKIKGEVDAFKAEFGITPGLAVVIVGENPASLVYVRNKHKACVEAGMNSIEVKLPENTSEEELLSKIDELNADDAVHGILVQLPLPRHISEDKVIARISPKKDVDAFHPSNVGMIMTGGYKFLPCTPSGVMDLLDYYKVELCGKRAVVIGRSNIVGKPMALLLLERNATVTVCHSRTSDIAMYTREADVVVVAVGRPNFLKAEMVKEGAVVIDVGINRLENGKLCGDVDFEAVSGVASLITPVPGGVGPMTITTLLKNTLSAAKESVK